jgi:tyrosine-protein kinase Etk/Wzc
VFLADEGQQIVDELADYGANLDKGKQASKHLTALLHETDVTRDLEDNLYTHQELLAFLRAQNVAGAHTLTEQYEPLIREMQSLRAENYSSEHPQVLTMNTQLQDMQTQIKRLAQQHMSTLREEQNKNRQHIARVQTNLLTLPSNQLRLAELERNRQIKENIVSTIMIRYNEAKVADAAIIPDAYVIDEARPPLVVESQIERLVKKYRKYIYGVLLGFILGIGLFLSLDYFDTKVKSARDVISKLDLPVLTAIPVIDEHKGPRSGKRVQRKVNPKLITSDYTVHIASEAFRLLRTKLYMAQLTESKSFIISSLMPGEGKTLVAANLAITFAHQKIPTLLVDCDLRRGDLHTYFATNREPGITDILANDGAGNEIDFSTIQQGTHVPNLYFLSSGSQVPNPSELLGGEKMKHFIRTMKENFDIIVFDTPPFELLPDALILNSLIHDIILIVRHGKTNLKKLNDKLVEFSTIKKDFAGVVINASDKVFKKRYGGYSYYDY